MPLMPASISRAVSAPLVAILVRGLGARAAFLLVGAAVFKNGLTAAQALHPRTLSLSGGLVHLLFGYRTLLLLLGWGGIAADVR